MNLGGVYYTYPGASGALNYDYFEIAASAGVSPIENLSLTAAYNYSPEYFGDSGEYHYPSASFEYAIPLKTPIALTLGGSIGYNMIEDEATFGVTDDYTDWSLSLCANYNILNLSVAYVDNDEPGKIGDAGFIFTVGASF